MNNRSGRALPALGLLALLSLGSVSSAAALDEGRARIDDHYFHRDQGTNLAESISELDLLIKKDGAPDLYWRRCRSLIRRGEKRASKSDKLADYDLARRDCEKAVALAPGSADAHFWYGVAMGRWGEAKGIFKALFLIKPIRHEMAETLRLDPDYGGAYRVLGEMLWQIPGFAGGDKKKAIEDYETSIRLSPKHSTNYVALAKAYLRFGRKDDAIRTLNAVIAMKDPDDPAEYAGDLADAKALLAKLTSK